MVRPLLLSFLHLAAPVVEIVPQWDYLNVVSGPTMVGMHRATTDMSTADCASIACSGDGASQDGWCNSVFGLQAGLEEGPRKVKKKNRKAESLPAWKLCMEQPPHFLRVPDHLKSASAPT